MKAHCTIIALFLSLGLLVSCMDDSRDFQKFDYDPDDYPDPLAESPYHIEDYHILKSSLNLPQIPFSYTLKLPQYMLDAGVREKEISEHKATLGRVLFYDKSLSVNGTVSCESCHRQAIAFSDNQKLSVGFREKETHRNSMALGSFVSMGAFHQSTTDGRGLPLLWDMKGQNSAHVSQLALTSLVEMGMTMEEVLERVTFTSHYPILFKTAFGDENITEERVLSSLESFVEGIGSYESKFDEAMTEANGDMEQDFASFSDSENRGKDLYFQHCGICHGFKLLQPTPYGNNGLDIIYEDDGIGFGSTPSSSWDVGQSFKTPSLRNVALTAPYMHDGSIESLREVIDFYSTGIQDHKDLSPVLRDINGDPIKLNFTEEEKTDLIAFLETLTDDKLLSYEKYSNPFK